MENEISLQHCINWFLKKGVLLSPDISPILVSFPREKLISLARFAKTNNHLIIGQAELDTFTALLQKKEEEKSQSMISAGKEEEDEKENNGVRIMFNYTENIKKRNVQDFIDHYNARYTKLKNMLMRRQEIENLVSINRLANKKERENVSIIGLISEKSETRNKNLIITLEDPTGSMKVIINKNKPDLFQRCAELVEDEAIAVIGTTGDNILFASNILQPEIPFANELKKAPKEEYAMFFSDIHVGSKYFMKDEFLKALKWLKGEIGNDEQKRIASRTRYIFMVGDLVDGVGIFPGQENELAIIDIKDQYEAFASLIRMIPKDKTIIICAGNHDAVRLSEPQPVINKDLAPSLHQMENVVMCTNPSFINIGATNEFSGINVLLYHGYSFDYYAQNVDMLRAGDAYSNPHLLMKFLLKKRHLAPVHVSSMFIPDTEDDYLVIDKVPDIFASGHVHSSSVAHYRNVTLIGGSCWQSTTPFQEKVGHVPHPARAPIINLATRDAKIMRFGGQHE